MNVQTRAGAEAKTWRDIMWHKAVEMVCMEYSMNRFCPAAPVHAAFNCHANQVQRGRTSQAERFHARSRVDHARAG